MRELATKIGISPDTLEATITDFNRACPSGPWDTSKFDRQRTYALLPAKSNWARPITEPPFGCFPIIASNTFTFGGLKVSPKAEVINASGVPVPGLYAAGETVGILYGAAWAPACRPNTSARSTDVAPMYSQAAHLSKSTKPRDTHA